MKDRIRRPTPMVKPAKYPWVAIAMTVGAVILVILFATVSEPRLWGWILLALYISYAILYWRRWFTQRDTAARDEDGPGATST